MRDREDDSAVARIVVAFDATPLEALALDAAAALASVLDAELAGIYVEDENLVRLAALPFAREYGIVSAAPRSMATADVERALRLQADRHREALARMAGALQLRWSFQVVRGRAGTAMLEHTREPDVVVFGKSRRGVLGRSVSLAALGQSLARRTSAHEARFSGLALRPIAVLFDGTPRGLRALAAAQAVAGIAKTRLAVLIFAPDVAGFGRLRDEARAWLDQRDATARFAWLRSIEVPEVVALTGAEDAVGLFWHEPALERQRLDALLAGLRCPLVLIR